MLSLYDCASAVVNDKSLSFSPQVMRAWTVEKTNRRGKRILIHERLASARTFCKTLYPVNPRQSLPISGGGARRSPWLERYR
jgi:hypothetical protein